LSRELLTVLETQQSNGWHDIVTLDEPWFYLSPDDECIWLALEESMPNREWHMIQSPKLMIITVIWNPSGFHIATAFPKGLKFNTGYYTREIF
jgi:hypothetical protein